MHPIYPGQVSALHRTLHANSMAWHCSGSGSGRLRIGAFRRIGGRPTCPSCKSKRPVTALFDQMNPSFLLWLFLALRAWRQRGDSVSGLYRVVPSSHRRDGGEKEQRSYWHVTKYGLVPHVCPTDSNDGPPRHGL
jgi:hypothetical protein